MDRHDEVVANRDRNLCSAGRRRGAGIRDIVDKRRVGFVPDSGDKRYLAFEGGAHQALFVERPEILDRTAAATDDKNVRAVFRRHGVEAPNARLDLRGGPVALHERWPDNDADRKALPDPVENIADDRACRTGHHADGTRKIGEGLLVPLVEQAFGGQLFLALFQQRHEGARAGWPHEVCDELIVGPALIDRESALRDDLQAFFRLEWETGDRSLPHYRVQDGLVVLDVSIHVA